MSDIIPYLSSNSFLWRKVEAAGIRKVSLDLLVELSELSISSIHVPFLCLHTDKHLRTQIRTSTILDTTILPLVESRVSCIPSKNSNQTVVGN